MVLQFGVPALAGPCRLLAEPHTDGRPRQGSWSQCTVVGPRRLSMNRRFVLVLVLVLVVVLVLVIDWLARLRGRARGRAGGRVGSRSQCTAEMARGLSMNRPPTESQQPFERGAEDARTPNAVARSVNSASAKRLECVRFIGAFRPRSDCAVHGPNACEKTKGALREPQFPNPKDE